MAVELPVEILLGVHDLGAGGSGTYTVAGCTAGVTVDLLPVTGSTAA